MERRDQSLRGAVTLDREELATRLACLRASRGNPYAPSEGHGTLESRGVENKYSADECSAGRGLGGVADG